MNIRSISTEELARKAGIRHHDCDHAGHALFERGAVSRRQFARTAGGAAVAGATTLGSGLWRPGVARAGGSSQPVPIPGGSPFFVNNFHEHFHVFGPASIDPADAEPATITDFNGFVGLAYISGTVKQKNTATGEVLTLPFVDSDMRFMKGVFRSTDGEIHRGAFALV
jgi:hypothetical protein